MISRNILLKGATIKPKNDESSTLVIDELISAEGSTALVYSGRDNEGHFVVLKEFYPMDAGIHRDPVTLDLDIDQEKYREDIELFERQAAVNDALRKLKNQTYSVYFSEMRIIHSHNTSYLVSTHDRQESFNAYLNAGQSGKRRLEDITGYTFVQRLEDVKSILEVVNMIHSRGYIHGDIKPSNLMLTDAVISGKPFLVPIDLGGCISLTEKVHPESISGSDGYCTGEWADLCGKRDIGVIGAEEITEKVHRIGKYNDIYSVAVIFSLLIFGKVKRSFTDTDSMFSSKLYRSWDLGPMQESFLRIAVDLMFDENSNGNTGINGLQMEIVLNSILAAVSNKTDLYSIGREGDYRLLKESGLIYMTEEDYDQYLARELFVKRIVANLNRCQIHKAEIIRFNNEEELAEKSVFRDDFSYVTSKGEKKAHQFLIGGVNSLGIAGKALELVLENGQDSVFVFGESGSGKSYLCASLYKTLLKSSEYVPIYCDAANVGDYEGDLLYLITCKLYSSTNYKSRIREYLLNELCSPFGQRYALLIDNIDKIPAQFFNSTMELFSEMKGAKVVVFGKDIAGMNKFKNRIEITGVIHNSEFEEKMIIPNPLFKLPFYLARYIKMTGGDINKAGRYPVSGSTATRILNDYFDNEITIERPLITRTLPRIAYSIKAEGTSIKQEDLYRIACSDLKADFSITKIEKILADLVEKSDLIKVSNVQTGTIGFTHDILLNYFAGYYAATVLDNLIEEKQNEDLIRELLLLTGTWDSLLIKECDTLLRVNYKKTIALESNRLWNKIHRFFSEGQQNIHITHTLKNYLGFSSNQILAVGESLYNISKLLLNGVENVADPFTVTLPDSLLQTAFFFAKYSTNCGYHKAANLCGISMASLKKPLRKAFNIQESGTDYFLYAASHGCGQALVNYGIFYLVSVRKQNRTDVETAIKCFERALSRDDMDSDEKTLLIINIIKGIIGGIYNVNFAGYYYYVSSNGFENILKYAFRLLHSSFNEITEYTFTHYDRKKYDEFYTYVGIILDECYELGIVSQEDEILNKMMQIGIPVAFMIATKNAKDDFEKLKLAKRELESKKFSDFYKDPNLVKRIANLYITNCWYDEGIKFFDSIDKQNADRNHSLGILLYLNGQTEEAIKILEDCIRKGSVAANYYYAVILVNKSLEEETLRIINLLWNVIKHPDSRLLLGELNWIKRKMCEGVEIEQKKSFSFSEDCFVTAFSLLLQIAGASPKAKMKWGAGTYIGNIINSIPDGFGIYITDFGEMYIGEWLSGKRNCELAYNIDTYGNLYIGGFRADQKTGVGYYVQKKYTAFQNYINDKVNGIRITILNNEDRLAGGITYAGKTENGLNNGEGLYIDLEKFLGDNEQVFLNYFDQNGVTYYNGKTGESIIEEGLWLEGDLVESKAIDLAGLLREVISYEYAPTVNLLRFIKQIAMSSLLKIITKDNGIITKADGYRTLELIKEWINLINQLPNDLQQFASINGGSLLSELRQVAEGYYKKGIIDGDCELFELYHQYWDLYVDITTMMVQCSQ